MQHILYGGDATATADVRKANMAGNTTSQEEMKHCVTGVDLLSTVIPDNQLALSWNIVNEPESKQLLVALSNTEKALYYRTGYARRNGIFELIYDECTGDWEKDCTENMDRVKKEYWRTQFLDMHNSSMTSHYQKLPFMQILQNKLNVTS
jgi:hypothetical protein